METADGQIVDFEPTDAGMIDVRVDRFVAFTLTPDAALSLTTDMLSVVAEVAPHKVAKWVAR